MADPRVVTAGALVQHDPDEVTMLHFDRSADTPTLAPIDTILLPRVPVAVITSAWSITGPDSLLTLDNPAIVSATTTAIRISGGTLGRIYSVSNKIGFNTNPSRIADASFRVLVQA